MADRTGEDRILLSECNRTGPFRNTRSFTNCTAGRRMVNVIATMKERHSQKPDELYDMIEHCSPAPFLEFFARSTRRGGPNGAMRFRQDERIAKEKVSPRPMEHGMIRPYRRPQLPLPLH